MLKFFRLFFPFGIGALIGGLTGYLLAIIFAHFLGLLQEELPLFRDAFGIASALAGWCVDSKLQITRNLHLRGWTAEFESAADLLRQSLIGHQEATEKAVQAQYELAMPPNVYGRIFKRNITKQVRNDKLWLVQNALPLIKNSIPKSSENNLYMWLETIEELLPCLAEARRVLGFFSRFRAQALAERTNSIWKVNRNAPPTLPPVSTPSPTVPP